MTQPGGVSIIAEQNPNPVEIHIILENSDPFFVAIPDSLLPTPESIVQTLQGKAVEVSQKILAYSQELPFVVLLFVGGKGRVLGERFVKLLRRQLIEGLCQNGVDVESAEAQVSQSMHPLYASGAINISSSFFARIPELEVFRYKEYEDDLQLLLQKIMSEHTIAPLEAMRATLSQAIAQAQVLAGQQPIFLLALDDQRASGMTADFTYRMVQDALADLANGGAIHVAYEMSLADNWSNLPNISINRMAESALSYKELFDKYLGLSGASKYTEDELRKMGILKRGIPSKTCEGVDMRAFGHFYARVIGGVAACVLRGGYKISQEGDEPNVLIQQTSDRILNFQTDCGRGLLRISIDVASLVERYNKEFDRLVL